MFGDYPARKVVDGLEFETYVGLSDYDLDGYNNEIQTYTCRIIVCADEEAPEAGGNLSFYHVHNHHCSLEYWIDMFDDDAPSMIDPTFMIPLVKDGRGQLCDLYDDKGPIEYVDELTAPEFSGLTITLHDLVFLNRLSLISEANSVDGIARIIEGISLHLDRPCVSLVIPEFGMSDNDIDPKILEELGFIKLHNEEYNMTCWVKDISKL